MYMYKGQTLRQYCIENNLKYDIIRSAIYRKGIDVESAIKFSLSEKPKTYKQIAEENGLSAELIYERIYKGWKLKDLYNPKISLSQASRDYHKLLGHHNLAEYFKTKKEKDRLKYWLDKGCMLEEAIRRTKIVKTPATYQGKMFKEWAVILEISERQLRDRVKKYGWDYAVNVPVDRERQNYGRMAKILSR